MRALTPTEVFELEDSVSRGYFRPLPDDYEPPPWLVARGLMKVTEEEIEETIVMTYETTPRGQLALRVHRAYLASMGETP